MHLVDLKDMEKTIVQFNSDSPWTNELLMTENYRYSVYYAPFEYVNTDAKVVIVGITPGVTQAEIALNMAKSALLSRKSIAEAQKLAKNTASFGGRMRDNLVEMLDYIGVNQALGLNSTMSLFEEDSSLVHFTSVLRFPVLDKGKMLSDASGTLSDSLLADLFNSGFRKEISLLKNPIYLPLGKGVDQVLTHLVSAGELKKEQVLSGLLHPSGANAERIAYFLGKKSRDALSTKTNAEKIDHRKDILLKRVKEILPIVAG